MALGGNVLRQHVVEFIRGTGIVTDGVVDATSLNGPWSWQVPDGVAEITLDGCGAGGGGGGGFNSTVSRPGGGGGGTGQVLKGAKAIVVPGSLLTVSVGAAGLGGAAGSDGTGGGNCVISGLLPGADFSGINQGNALDNGAIWIRGGSQGTSQGGGGSEGGKAGAGRFDFGMAVGIFGPNNAASPGNGANVVGVTNFSLGGVANFGIGGAAGGPASTTGSVAGGGGGLTHDSRHPMFWTNGFSTRAAGSTDGTNSYGGGGRGGFTIFGLGGPGGNGQNPGGNATGYGAGGGGGGGGAAGGNGADGYVRFTYWSMD